MNSQIELDRALYECGYSFERLGFNTSPAQASPYPLDSLFVQDNYPVGEFSLHQPTALEFDVLIRRQSAALAGTNVFALEAQFIPQNQKLNSGAIPVVKWAGQNVELFLGLVGGSSSNATVTIDALRFYQLARPNLSISISGNAAVISWPVSAQGYVLEYANSLTGTNSWDAATNTPAASGLWNVVTNSIAGEHVFYRLRK